MLKVCYAQLGMMRNDSRLVFEYIFKTFDSSDNSGFIGLLFVFSNVV